MFPHKTMTGSIRRLLKRVARKRVTGWLVAPTERTVLQAPRALIASMFAAFLDVGMLVALVERGDWSPVHAAIVSYVLGGILQYILCSIWVFPAAPQNVALGFTAFTMLSLIGLGITWAVMRIVHDAAGLHYSIAKTGALGLTFVWNFSSRKYFLFKPGR